jgi:hypothetical protein
MAPTSTWDGAVLGDPLVVEVDAPVVVVDVLAALPFEQPAAAATTPRISTYRQDDSRLRCFTFESPFD